MKRQIQTAETILLFSASLVTLLILGTPPSRQRSLDLKQPQHVLKQAPSSWENELILPTQSARVSSYEMDVRLDPPTGMITGTEVLTWKNATGAAQSVFPFHLYHNAWKNNRSTYAREEGWQLTDGSMSPGDYGYTTISRVVLLEDAAETDITGTIAYIQPDDGNPDDQTVFQVTTPRPIRPGAVMRLRIDFVTKQPIPIRRTGKIRDYHFVVQWFPKIGVFWKGAWNCHQFHANTEFFSDYGVYDVRITLPDSYRIGATGGIPRSTTRNSDGTTTHRFVQEDVHDFAWLASPDLVISRRTFSHREAISGERLDRHHRLRDVEVIVITPPHHDNTIERYFDATFKALRYFGEWYGEYPYSTVTVVDPANGSNADGMEYPTLFTGGTTMFEARRTPSPESVTVHEFGHQFWYGLVANNEFEEAWLDEGFNSYSQDRVLMHGWSDTPFDFTRTPWRTGSKFFGGSGAGTFVGIPFVWDAMPTLRMSQGNTQVRILGKNDPMVRRGWEYLRSYRLNAYTKPSLSLHMLERYVGEETMYRIMRTYHHRFRFQHPTSTDFINVVREIAGSEFEWFFENTWYSSELFDYAITEVTNSAVPPAEGGFTNSRGDTTHPTANPGKYWSEVVVQRLGEARAPVDVLITFADGTSRLDEWDGKERWKIFGWFGDIPVSSAIVDPYNKLVLDIDWVNNSVVLPSAEGPSLAARKWGLSVLFWMQTYLDMNTGW